MRPPSAAGDRRGSPLVLAQIVVGGLALVPVGSSPILSPEIFVDRASQTGLVFTHFNGATGEYYLPEIMGSGAALLDYDSDGDLDVYLVQGSPVVPSLHRQPPGNRLFRNQLRPSGTLRFRDVTEEAGVGHVGDGMGVAVADYDNDGDPDLYVTNFGPNVLYRNNGDGTFTDVTGQSGGDDARWTTSASFLDYDRDGDPDLFVTNYVAFSRRSNKRCSGSTGRRDYCSPTVYPPLVDRLFKNDAGRFADVSTEAGITTAFGSGLGVVAADFNRDGWPDIYVANDQRPNQLWINKRDGTFVDRALFSGVAVNGLGVATGSMGVSAGDFDGDCDDDLFITNLINESNTLFVNAGNALFRDATAEHGLASDSIPMTGFGTEWFDYDNDGALDLFVANGAVTALPALIGRDPHPYHQANQLFRQVEGTRFKNVSESAGEALRLVETSRGAAFGDIDNDGDIDIVVTNNAGPVRLLLNQVGNRQGWLLVKLAGTRSGRDAMGARVALELAGRRTMWRRAHTDGSYLSAHDPRIHFGTGKASRAVAVTVEWPSGLREVWRDVELNQPLQLREGTGRALRGPP